MANGYFERGEMYDILFGDGLAGEMAAHRPGIIVSSDRGNSTNPSVLMIYTTTTTTANKQISVNHEFNMNGWRNYALCNQIVTVNKNRIKKFYGKLPKWDMDKIDDCLKEAMSLDYVDETALKAKDAEIKSRDVLIGDLKNEVAGVKATVEKKDEEIASLKMEIEMWQKCYGRCMDMLVATKVNADLSRRVEKLPEQPKEPAKVIDPEEPVLNVPVKPVKVVVTETRVDINHCTQTQLEKIGMSDGLARAVVAKRPFQSVSDLKNVPGMSKKKFQIWEPKLTCTPLEIIEIPAEPVVPEAEVVTAATETEPVTETEGKLNINAVSGRDLIDNLGLSSPTAYTITGYRRKNGPYAKLEDILASGVSQGMLTRIRDKIYCGPGIEEKQIERKPKVEEPIEPYTGPKVNINTASAKEIHDITGLDMTVCYSITGCRKRDGLYRDVEDVRNIPRFTDYHWAKYGQMFEV